MQSRTDENLLSPDAAYGNELSSRSYATRAAARKGLDKELIIKNDNNVGEDDADVIITGSRRISPRHASQRMMTQTSLTPITAPAFTNRSIVGPPASMSMSDYTFQPVNYAAKDQVGNTSKTNREAVCLENLPVEMFQMIAGYLDTDGDIAALSQVSKECKNKITSSVWIAKFRGRFDTIKCSDDIDNSKLGGLTREGLATEYKRRMRIVYCTPMFDEHNLVDKHRAEGRHLNLRATAAGHGLALSLIKSLILESNAVRIIENSGKSVVVAKNLDFIHSWIFERTTGKNLDLLNAALNTSSDDPRFWSHDKIVSSKSPGSFLLIVQLCLTHLALNTNCIFYKGNVLLSPPGFDSAQAQVYASEVVQPLFMGKCKETLNVRWALHVVQWFKFNFLAPNSEGLFYDIYHNLHSQQMPQPWFGRIKGGTQPIGSHWKGIFTFLDPRDLMITRENPDIDRHYLNHHDDEIQDLSLFFDEVAFPSCAWPHKLDNLFVTDPYPAPASSIGSSRHGHFFEPLPEKYPLSTFFGTTRDARPAHFFGRLHGLPAQQGIAGFQRISFIKFCTQSSEMDEEDVWEYEGVVLPGGRIIIGRWSWVAINTQPPPPEERFSGPFMFWNVDESTADPPIAAEEALEFRKSLVFHGIL